MRLAIVIGGLWALSACGGGGGGGGDAAAVEEFDADVSQTETVDFLTVLQGDVPTGMLDPGAVPPGRIAMTGGAAARIGWTGEALMGAARMTADFDRAFVSGNIDQVGLYSVSPDLPLYQTTPQKLADLEGQITFSGPISRGSAVTFDLSHTGTVSGTTGQQPVQMDIAARTPDGAFLTEGGEIAAFGQIVGDVTIRQPNGGHGVTERLNEGRIFVRQ